MEWINDVKIIVKRRDDKFDVVVDSIVGGNSHNEYYSFDTESQALAKAKHLAKHHELFSKGESKQLEEEPTATCVMNTGMEDRFDVGVSYLVTPTADLAMLLATDKYGVEVEVMAERFKMDEVQKPLSKIDQRINELLAIVHKYENEVNPQAKEYQDALAELEPLIDEQDKQEADENAESIQLATCGTCIHFHRQKKTSGKCKVMAVVLRDSFPSCSSYNKQVQPRSCLECALFDQKDGLPTLSTRASIGKCAWKKRGIAVIVKGCSHFVGVDS